MTRGDQNKSRQKSEFVFCFPLKASGIIVPRPGIEPRPPLYAVEPWNPNHWTARESPHNKNLDESESSLLLQE